MKRILAVVAFLVVPSPAYCWNNTGHMVAARLAWLKLDEEQRSKAISILKKHPHYDEFLTTDKPNGFSEDEWVFLRAATWPDWVRNHHKAEFHHATWHYINYPFVEPGSMIDPAKHQPPPDEENVVWKLGNAVKQMKNGNQEDQAVNLCWILHLVGDIHQPLHTAAYFSDLFPEGDRGGNLAYIVLHDGANKTKLHPMWDGLLGKSTTASAIGRVVKQVQELPVADKQVIKNNLNDHKSIESWAKESFEIAKKAAYLNGELPMGDDDEDAGEIGVAPEDYARKAGHVARVQIAKAGSRLAMTLADLLK
ncbi:MAG TPA: S1/P1 nuclease [Gemmataceae bacterium]|nr:S1/P1 nuclease [Gemmataceae bacterium]